MDLENHPWRLAAILFVVTFAVPLGFLMLALDQSFGEAAAYSLAYATVFSVLTGIARTLRLRRDR